VVAVSAEGAWITDVEGRRFLDCLAAYSAVNFGHRNPEIAGYSELRSPADRVTVDRHDYRYRQLDHLLVELVQQVAHPSPFLVFEVQVRAGAERLRCGRSDDDDTCVHLVECR
jgi:4-aminobutyrate aminotransferase-like enzyme